eukprot:1195459-Prorocentrum_minimum.AAC.9
MQPSPQIFTKRFGSQGLGKTLQGITLLWTLLRQGFGPEPIAKRVLIVCPTSLVSNWDAECDKVSPAGRTATETVSETDCDCDRGRDRYCDWQFLKGRVKTLPLAESCRADVIDSITQFLRPNHIHQVLAPYPRTSCV